MEHNADPTLRGGRSGILNGMPRRLARPLALVALALAAVILAACGGSDAAGTGGATATTSAAGKRTALARLAAAPAALRANAADADTLAGEGTDAITVWRSPSVSSAVSTARSGSGPPGVRAAKAALL